MECCRLCEIHKMGGKNKMSCNELFNNKLSRIGYRLSKSYLKKENHTIQMCTYKITNLLGVKSYILELVTQIFTEN